MIKSNALAWYKNYKNIKGHDRTLFFLLQQTSNNHPRQTELFQEVSCSIFQALKPYGVFLVGGEMKIKEGVAPELGATLVKFVRKEVGDQAILPKVPMFQQDMEHILDCVGIKTQSDLQRE